MTVTDEHGHAIGHGCARPEPKNHRKRAGPGPPGFTFTPASRDGPPGGYGTWRLHTPGNGPDLLVTLDPLTTQDCDHRFESRGHDPGVKLRHLSQIRHATCTSPICRRPASQCDFEHNTPYEAGGRTCLCNGGPKCRHDHRLKQHPKWTGRPAPRRHLPVDHPGRAYLHHRTHEVPHMRGRSRLARISRAADRVISRGYDRLGAESGWSRVWVVDRPLIARCVPPHEQALTKNARQPSGSGRAASGPSGP